MIPPIPQPARKSRPLRAIQDANAGRLRACCTAVLAWCAALSLLLPLVGCGRDEPPPPPYNHLRNQIVEELFAALLDQNPELALSHLHRLASFSEQTSFVNLLIIQEQNRLLAQQVNRHLRQGRIQAARQVAQEHIARYGPENFSEQAHRIIVELALVERFVEAAPSDSKARQEQLDTLLANLETVSQEESFEPWLNRQRTIIAELREAEIRQAVRETLEAMEQAIVEGRCRDLPSWFERLTGLRPRHPLVLMHQRWRQTQPPASIADFAPDLETAKDGQRQRLLELGLRLDLPQLAEHPQTAATVLAELRDLPPASPAGLDLRWRLADLLGRTEAMLEFGRHFIEAGGRLDAAALAAAMERHYLPREQALASPWGTPFPTVTDLFNRIAQIREHRGTKAGPNASNNQ